ncbi:MAG: DCC1-like thiol-disulfide oxidoreductase family protein [Myxococcota bacterium]|nr:DCC1-like thiol-disulfide oxidoreductase family protein [Myxococcota bacterium]
MDSELPQRLLLYDGECGLCDRFVQWVLEQDEAGLFHFAPLQGETATRLRENLEIPDGLDTAVLVESGVVHLRSGAVLRVLGALSAPWSWFSLLRVFPRFLTDPMYRVVARIRHRLLGGRDSCRLSGVGESGRFLP